MASSKSLCALVIAKDEELDLPGCLASLKGLADEVVVLVDASTTDKTEELARAAGAKVSRRPFDDYARQRQAALELCTKDWVLWIDADERADGALAQAIRRVLALPSCQAYALRFAVRFMGRPLRFGGMGREEHVRLFERAKGRFTGGALHESLLIDGRTGGPLDGFVEHEPYRDLADYLQKLDRYTTLAAEKKFAAGIRYHWWHQLILPLEFLKRALLKAGFLDGTAGITYAALSACHHWLKYVKLREMENA